MVLCLLALVTVLLPANLERFSVNIHCSDTGVFAVRCFDCTALLVTSVQCSLMYYPDPQQTSQPYIVVNCNGDSHMSLYCTSTSLYSSITLHSVSADQPCTVLNCTYFYQMSLHCTERQILGRWDERVCSDRWINTVWPYGGKSWCWWVIQLFLGLPTLQGVHVAITSSAYKVQL